VNVLDPTKHLLGYGRRNPATGLLHGHIRWPDGTAPTPFGCRWCGVEQSGHGRRWIPGKGMHVWDRPTEAQVKARMLARRQERLNAETPQYHAGTDWTGTPGDPEDPGEPMCADCRDTRCPRWMRIQQKLDRQRWREAGIPFGTSIPGGWGGGAPW
jgi:hypothetical protein